MIGRCNRKCKRDLAPSDVSFASSVSVSYGYQDSAHKHAVTSAGSNTYAYDANGNMTTRVEGGLTYTQTFNAENRLASVTVNSQTTQFIYDGDGNLVKRINPDNSSAIYIGGVYEADKASNGSVVHTFVYYPAGGAMRKDGTLYFALKDQLGSVSVVTDASGNVLSRQRYQPFGQVRTDVGPTVTQTDFGYTSQRNLANIGLMDYHARMYDAALGRFIQPDTIVPDLTNPQALNRYSYVFDDPIGLSDPSGHGDNCPDLSGYMCRRRLGLRDSSSGNGSANTNPWAGVLSSATYGCSAITLACLTGSAIGESSSGYGFSVAGGDIKNGLDFTGYSGLEQQILQYLYDNGNADAVHGVEYILANHINIVMVPESDYHASVFGRGAWFDDSAVYIVGNANNIMDPQRLAKIIHEALHIEQGPILSHTWEGEMYAWQAEFRITRDLPGGSIGPKQQNVLNAHDPWSFVAAANAFAGPIYTVPMVLAYNNIPNYNLLVRGRRFPTIP